MRRFSRIGVLLAVVLAASPAGADQNDARLAPLFDELAAAGNAETAAPIEARIWAIWLVSDDAQVSDLMARGSASLAAGDFSSALATFDAVVGAAPDFAEGWNKRATALYLLGRAADSIKDIDRVLALEPRHFGALAGLGLCRALLHDDRAALDAFARALRVDPYLPGARRNFEALKQQVEGQPI